MVFLATMTLAIPDDLKREMDKCTFINWSAVARDAIATQINSLKLVESITKNSKLTEKDIEEIGAQIKKGIARAHEKKA